LFFFDRFNIPSQTRRLSEIRAIERYREFYATEIARNKAILEELQSGSDALEEYGRETYFMKRDNEDVFIVEPAPAQ
jgi:cell division protein DivIC